MREVYCWEVVHFHFFILPLFIKNYTLNAYNQIYGLKNKKYKNPDSINGIQAPALLFRILFRRQKNQLSRMALKSVLEIVDNRGDNANSLDVGSA